MAWVIVMPWVARSWDEYLLHTFSLRRSPLIRDPIGTLTERFVQDLNAWATVRRILLCCDDFQYWTAESVPAGEAGTTDTMAADQAARKPLAARKLLADQNPIAGTSQAGEYGPAAWLFDLLARGHLSTNIWFLIASRDPLPRVWEALAPVTTELHATFTVTTREQHLAAHSGGCR